MPTRVNGPPAATKPVLDVNTSPAGSSDIRQEAEHIRSSVRQQQQGPGRDLTSKLRRNRTGTPQGMMDQFKAAMPWQRTWTEPRQTCAVCLMWSAGGTCGQTRVFIYAEIRPDLIPSQHVLESYGQVKMIITQYVFIPPQGER